MGTIRESDLPGIGKKYQLEANSGSKMVVVIHNDGRRELYHFLDEDPDECISQVSLDDEESRQIASIIGGMQYKPKALDSIQVTLEGLVIEWCKIEPNFKSIHKSISQLQVRARTGATILAIVEKGSQKINPGPDDIITAGMTLVIAGERSQIKQLHDLLLEG